MTFFRTTEPAVEPVTLAEARAHLRVQSDSEDALIASLIRAARDDVERSAGLALIDQTWRLCLDDWPLNGRVEIPRHPVREVLGIVTYDALGAPHALAAGHYFAELSGRPARLLLTEPAGSLRAINGIEIDLRLGYGESGPDVPDILKRAMLVLVAHWYELRAAVAPQDQPSSYPAIYDRLIAGYRRRRI